MKNSSSIEEIYYRSFPLSVGGFINSFKKNKNELSASNIISFMNNELGKMFIVNKINVYWIAFAEATMRILDAIKDNIHPSETFHDFPEDFSIEKLRIQLSNNDSSKDKKELVSIFIKCCDTLTEI